ncbi:patatin-like phospholipase family protein [Nitrosomonas europaea]|uniref:patatin-like phospholipase family protein n=1 Tax=Nitrosomonas europaea TaxID=915 RepID=UPI00079AD2C5|nr:patatin-like phospholipase family protein [Nitrosomonas europaea]KXK44558.1 MAG: Patatin-like phospholipase [Nitrosomonas europaea]
MNPNDTSDTETREPPADRFCDLVMKGGITSGVVYPRAIRRLSEHYRFRGIGGTSAGAIAAAITAAAEYQRRENNGSREGFNLLGSLPEELGSEVKKGKYKLLSLFQPQPATRRLFAVLVRTLNKSSTKSRWFSVFQGLLIAYWPATVLSMIVALAVAQSGAWLAAFLLLVIALLLSIGYWVYSDITGKVVANGFGLCNGMSREGELEALTPWLHSKIQKAAGRDAKDKPLTFGDLWDAKGFPPTWRSIPEGVRKRSIDLQVFSTNLAHGRPYVFPLAEPETGESRFRSHESLYFTEAEMKEYFPSEVVQWMVEKSPAKSKEDGKDMLELPEPEHFPVVLATRMSLAFPFLISAIPLYAIDRDLTDERKFRRCWFSDGGISSNFPIHLFDGLVPVWPTFGIHLEPAIMKNRKKFYLPSRYDEGYEESWSLFAEKPEPAGILGGFISAIINTMQNWNDNTVRLMPGFRDRVARVRLEDGEGGMNLNMEPHIIEDLAERGEEAANELIRRFASSNGNVAVGWDEHRFVRFNNLLKMMKARVPNLVEALGDDCKYATRMEDLLEKLSCATDDNGKLIPPPGYEEPMTQQEREAYKIIVAALNALATVMNNQKYNIPFKPIPKPEPELRVRPPL